MSFGLPQQLAGQLDRRVELWRYSLTYNELNEPVETYVHAATVWARVFHMSAREIYSAETFQAFRTTKFYVRFRADITEKDRIRHDGEMYKIIGLVEMGRREMLEVTAEWIEGLANGGG